jgi:hypothetical protein
MDISPQRHKDAKIFSLQSAFLRTGIRGASAHGGGFVHGWLKKFYAQGQLAKRKTQRIGVT